MIRKFFTIIFLLTFLIPFFPPEISSVNDSRAMQTDYESQIAFEECTSIIVTGSAAKDGRAILMKTRDSAQTINVPVYHPATDDTYAFVAVNSMWMGINEKGLAVMNTAMPALSDNADLGSLNGIVNRRILERCSNISDVLRQLRAKDNPIIDTSVGTIASCIGLVDANGEGAFLETSNTFSSIEYVIDGFQSRANHPRTYPGLASGPSGRDQYALDALNAIYTVEGEISWQDVAQNVSRYVNNKELGETVFSISGEICNQNTVAAMVAVSGDDRYDGALNAIWCSYGRTPIVSVFLPSIVAAGSTPTILNDMYSYTEEKRDYASQDGILYNPRVVEEIQDYAFSAEDYTFEQYDRLMEKIPVGLSQSDLQATTSDFIDLTVTVGADMYVNETESLPEYATSFDITIPPSNLVTSVTSSSTTTTSGNSNNTPIGTDALGYIGATIGIGVISVIIIALYKKWKTT
ncbi:MAG: hypothetical protein GF411_19275 [Candidatus Lokiarchaeota archaeon]|nr:hypothetical protein [Candidatus Lokiarchaeota archaeon]